MLIFSLCRDSHLRLLKYQAASPSILGDNRALLRGPSNENHQEMQKKEGRRHLALGDETDVVPQESHGQLRNTLVDSVGEEGKQSETLLLTFSNNFSYFTRVDLHPYFIYKALLVSSTALSSLLLLPEYLLMPVGWLYRASSLVLTS